MRFLPVLLAALTCLIARPTLAADRAAANAPSAAAGSVRQEAVGPVAAPEPSETAIEYYRSGNVLWIVSQVLGLAIPALLLFTGLSARMRTLARRIGRR
jgi:hypothetical protein